MINPAETSQIQQITQEIDRLIVEMIALRQRVLSLESAPPPVESVRNRPYFGMWTDREDFQNRTSREWLEEQRQRQWNRP